MAGWSIALAILLAVFVLLHILILPKIFLRADRGRLPVTGRGIKSYESKSGLSIVYEPDSDTAKFIKQYVLFSRNGKKHLVCKTDEKIRYINFDVAVFGKDGNTIKILNVKEIISRQGFTEACELPEETAYVTLCLNEVNGQKKSNGLRGGISPKNLAWYLSLSAAADISCAVFAKICITNICGGIYGESFLLSGIDWLYTMLAALAVVAVNITAALICILYKSGRLKGARDGKL